MSTEETRDIRIKRLLYQTWYRGCKETDKVVGSFARDHIHSLSDAELDDFEQVLDEEDKYIYQWLTGVEPIPDDLKNNSVLPKIMAYEYHQA